LRIARRARTLLVPRRDQIAHRACDRGDGVALAGAVGK
jgi:hypothetical protein